MLDVVHQDMAMMPGNQGIEIANTQLPPYLAHLDISATHQHHSLLSFAKQVIAFVSHPAFSTFMRSI
jgi:hypothetical protein